MSASATETGPGFYRPELDALRFFAFFAVFVHHLGRAAGTARWGRWAESASDSGSFGMCLFFLLSAYLITELLLMEQARTGRVRVRDFYVRRVLRIWPLYFSFIALCAILSWVWPAEFHAGGARIAAFLFLAGNWYVAGYGFSPPALSTLWSISLEEQFYLLWPGLVKLGAGRRGVVAGCVLFTLASIGAMGYLGISGAGNEGRIWMNSLVQFLFFAGGAALALTIGGRKLHSSALQRVALLGGGVLTWVLADFLTGIKREDAIVHSASLMEGYGMVLIGTVMIFLAFAGMEQTPRWLRYLGKISYGLYVFHRLVLQIVLLAASRAVQSGIFGSQTRGIATTLIPICTLVITIALAAGSYRFLEAPFLRLRQRFTAVPSRAV